MPDNECDCWYDIAELKEAIKQLKDEMDDADYRLYHARQDINGLWQAIETMREDD